MTLQLYILGIVLFFAPLVPPILSPLGYSLTGILLIQKANPRILSLINVGVGTITAALIRIIQNRVIKKLVIYDDINKKDLFSHMIRKINTYFKNQKRLSKISLKREKYIETKTGKIATFFFAIFCFLPVIPDIISTRILYKKIRFPYFILAVIIGKTGSHVPFIFLGKSILEICYTRIIK